MKLAVIAAITTAFLLVAPNAFALNADMTEVDAGELDLGEDLAGVMAIPDMAFNNGDDIPEFVDLFTPDLAHVGSHHSSGCSYAAGDASPMSALLLVALTWLFVRRRAHPLVSRDPRQVWTACRVRTVPRVTTA